MITKFRQRLSVGLVLGLAVAFTGTSVSGAPLSIVNAGFGDTTGQSTFNEFTFGTPTGWTLHDPNLITGGPGFFSGYAAAQRGRFL